MTNLLTQIQWAQVGIVLGIFTAIAVVLLMCILLVSKFCKTTADETAEKILSHLAGANCGGCGCTGCAAFAEKLMRGEAVPDDCHVTNAEDKKAVSELLGLPFSGAKPTVSVCRCAGGDNAKNQFEYVGARDCSAQIKLNGGKKACKYGCLEMGNCVRACSQSTIALHENCANVNPEKCTSCGACIRTCPKNLFMRIPADAKIYVACSSHERGKAVLDVCAVGCIACGKCAKTCPSGAIAMQDYLPVIDYEKCINCGECAKVCPRQTIHTRY